ncbi:structural maintenance of chromosomes protein 5 [Nematocida major]|uniref:structural maintenance of chromosomes protein 5 n=1 Tax=Nematocida major TaxID=1912982 RepID=UPI002007D595|nr:structural maintenance of chromosomes protein 5 [Nematocida major]KAH9385631.1 structural maintenance of chromosomes protein 5 [Nematocida major]
MNTYLHSLVLNNFQKYANSTFIFSPHGNLIAGLNGSGKSTVAAAIALTLGGTSKTVGKPLATHELIKFGETKAVSELVIKTTRREEISKIVKIHGRSKVIDVSIARTITAVGSSYKINGMPASLSQVKEVASALDIQINNLGQFLPQDKVTEFSSLAEEEQLETTLKTCNPELLQKKKDLEEVSDNLAECKKKLQTEKEQQTKLKAKMEVLEEESKKLKEFLDRKEQISLLQCKIKWVEYQILKDKRDLVVEKLRKHKEEYMEKQQKISALESEYLQEMDILQKEKTDIIKGMEVEEFNLQVREIEKIQRHEKIASEKISVIQGKIARLNQEKTEIAQWKVVKETEKPAPKMTAHLQQEYAALEGEYRENKMEDSSWQVESALKAMEIQKLEVSLKKEEEGENRLLEELKNLHKDTYTAINIMKQSEKKWAVDFPAILTMKVIREEYKEELSSQLNLHALTSFVCHSRESFLEFIREFKEERGLAINIVEKQKHTAEVAPDALAPASTEIDSKYKMVYLSECIEAPPAVKEFLNIFSKLSLIPVTKAALSNEREFFNAHRKITRIISNRKVIEIKRSPYTKDETLVIYPIAKGVGILMKPKGLGTLEALEALKQEREKRAAHRQGVLRKREQLEKRLRELKGLRESDAVESEKHERLQRAMQAYKERAEEISVESKQLTAQKEELQQEVKRLQKERALPWKKLPIAAMLKELESISKRSKELKALHEELQGKQCLLDSEKHLLKTMHGSILQCSSEADNLKHQAVQKLAEAEATYSLKTESEEKKAKLKEMPSCVQTLTFLLEQEKAKAELSIVDYSAIEEYEKCKAEMQQRAKLLRKDEKEAGTAEAIKKQKEADLVLEIDALVQQINGHAHSLFSSAGIGADVHVHYTESPRMWKLVLKVQFRSEGSLEVLSAGRHSGGEKAVSIILYLLSMQKLSNSPFLLVDEINQGMDAAHERTIHSMLVGSKAASTKQTIVITPKLISGLDYSESTKVHLIIETA